jgi:putative protease
MPTYADRPSRPELLCPAGDFDAMRAAVANGADAVYFGLDVHNARQRARNFKLDELPETVRFLHAHNVKAFVTFNTLVFSDELPGAVDYLRAIAAAGVDAVIVQDLGLARLIRRLAPTLEVHGSTQMTLTEPRGIDFVRKLGVARVVVARELSIDDIAKIRAACAMPLEVFIHGALCVAYSGQCLTSESLGGRSANRGVCAQACRMPYTMIVDGREKPSAEKYLVSPTDLAAPDLVGRLSELGVASLKIEGRLKDAHYVAMTAQTYRAAIDAGASFSLPDDQWRDLNVVYSRTFTHGFLGGVNHQQLVPGRFPKARGLRVGKLLYTSGRAFVIELDDDVPDNVLKNGDGIVFDEGRPETDEAHGQVYRVEVRKPRPARGHPTSSRKTHLFLELGNRDARPGEVALGAIVWKNSDPQLDKRLDQSFARDRVVHRAPIDITLIAHVGSTPVLQMTDGTDAVESRSQHVLEPAEKHPLTEDFARKQLDRLLDTPFVLRSLRLRSTGGPMLPASILADLRRDAVRRLIDARHARLVHAIAEPDVLVSMRDEIARQPAAPAAPAASATSPSPAPSQPQLHLLVRSLEQLDAALALPDDLRPASVYCDFEDVRRYALAVPRARSAGVPITLATMRIIKPGEEGWLRHVLNNQPDAILVRNLAGVGFYSEVAPHLPLIGDFSLNIANELTAHLFREAGLLRMVPSYDLSWNQLAAMISRFDPARFECVVHQHMPMFHMEHCVFARMLSDGKDYRDCGRPCDKHRVELRDGHGKPHPLIPDAGCRNTLFNADAQSALEYLPRMKELGIVHYRVELLRESPGDVEPLVRGYRAVLAGAQQPKPTLRSLRVLSQLGVSAGTLERD